MRYAVLLPVLFVSACAVTSVVMQGRGGTYVIPARATPTADGTVAANDWAYQEARKFCSSMSGGARAVVVDDPGTADLRFRCEQIRPQAHAG